MDRSVSDSADATPSPTPRDARSNTPGRKYGFSCSACRRRKVRCDAHKPTCRGCVRLGEACVYPTASNASVARLTSALERSEARVATLQETLSRQGQPEAARTAEEPGEPGEPGEPREPGQVDTHAETQPASAADKGLVLDEHGTVQYYGATSRFHLALPPQAGPGGLGGVPPVPPPDEAYHRRWLLSNARFQAVWDRAVLANLRALTHDVIRAETGGAVLLDIFWTWQAPLHNYMYRRTFTRDMALGGEGPYFSALLLNVILAHACRHVPADDATFAPYEKGDVFLRRAKMLLMEDLEHDKPRIPTIQALLLLGGRQCAVGRNAQGWLYTGMAIRMLKHLGWHLPKAEAVPQSYQGQHGQQGQHGHGQHCVSLLERLEPDDLEARKRLCLSAYVWDKSISFCLGRPPELPVMPYPPMSLFDTSDDLETWRPFYIDAEESASAPAPYPPTPSYSTTTFLYFCEQAKIMNAMYETIYSPSTAAGIDTDTVRDIERTLRAFYQRLPNHIRVDDVDALPVCPPPHIFTLNILYHTSLILLYRPFFSISSSSSSSSSSPSSSSSTSAALKQRAREVCTAEAAKVHAFFRAYGHTFRWRNQTYLTTYCVYTAATIEVQQVRHPDPAVASQAVDRLATTLRMLEAECQQTPGIRRSIDIIKTQLGGVDLVALAGGTDPLALVPTTLVLDEPPPHPQPQPLPPPPPATDLGGMDLVGSGLLGPSWLDWYMPDAGGGFIPNQNT